MACVIEIGLGHHRILAHDVQRPYAARPDFAQNFRRRQPQSTIKPVGLDIPCLLEFACGRFVIDPLITRVVPWYGAGIGRALHVVLPA